MSVEDSADIAKLLGEHVGEAIVGVITGGAAGAFGKFMKLVSGKSKKLFSGAKSSRTSGGCAADRACFVAGTAVLALTLSLPIESIEPGQLLDAPSESEAIEIDEAAAAEISEACGVVELVSEDGRRRIELLRRLDTPRAAH